MEWTSALDIKERCRDCTFFHKFKYMEGGEWKYKDCCVALAEDSPDYETFVLEVHEYDFCEMYTDREEYKRLKDGGENE